MEFHEAMVGILILFVVIQRWYIYDLQKRVERLEKD